MVRRCARWPIGTGRFVGVPSGPLGRFVGVPGGPLGRFEVCPVAHWDGSYIKQNKKFPDTYVDV